MRITLSQATLTRPSSTDAPCARTGPLLRKFPYPTSIVDATSTARPEAMSRCVFLLVPRHSRSATPHKVLKMMMLAMCIVQLENS